MPLPLTKNVVLIGGGHAHALVMRSWAMNPTAGARVTVINPEPTAPYTGMLPGFIAGHYTRAELDIDLVKLGRFADVRLVLGRATGIDREARTVTVQGRPPIPYDICSINVGITSELRNLPGFMEHAVPAKPLGRFADQWTRFVGERAGETTAPRVAVIGGGVGGSELAMAMSFRLRQDGHEPQVTVIDRSTILEEVGEMAHKELRKAMAGLGVEVREQTAVEAVEADHLVLNSAGSTERLAVDFVVGAAGAQPMPWVSELGLATTDGFIDVRETLQTTTDPNIFAVGDCANLTFNPRPKAGVYAVREAPYLLDNIQASLQGNELKAFDPQADYLKLVSLGKKSAGADKFKRFTKGPGVWRLKDRIDRKFMDKLGDLPQMTPPKVPKNAVDGLARQLDSQPPLCGGCGAKVGLDVLAGPLGALPPSQRDDVIRLPGDDAALLSFGDVKQVVTTDQVREFTPDPFRMARIATLHALGDIWAMGAAPQAVLATVTLPQLGRGLQEEWLSEIMAGTAISLAGSGAEVVGGHTSMGSELSLGYSITGLVEGDPISLAGARIGQSLVLTRPIGSGVLFAAEMQGKARGQDMETLLDTLEIPQGAAAAILKNFGATAMTDVTGFGLAGHIHGMLTQSKVGASVDISAVPIFAGALDMSNIGVRSHLFESNAAAVPVIQEGFDSRFRLVHDPQTAGGLLAAVPEENAAEIVTALHAAGFADSAIIGTITETPGELRLS